MGERSQLLRAWVGFYEPKLKTVGDILSLKMMKSVFRLIILVGCFSFAKAQENYKLKKPDPRDYQKACGEFQKRIDELPADVTIGLFEKDGDIIWGITDDRYLARIFKDNKDGVAVDILTKSQFPCGQKKNLLNESEIHDGELLKPVYLKDVKNHILTDNFGMAGFKVGELPEAYKNCEYELNMLLIHDGYVCRYDAFYDIPRARWELLEMPLFLDSVKQIEKDGAMKSVVLEKELQFVIPFRKNKITYTEVDIRPLYDSLKLTDFTIKSISIQAYASVEGPTDNNIRLQNERAAAIAKALEKAQKKEAVKTIKAEENWVEFFQDIDTSQYKEMSGLSREEIKERFEDEKFNNLLEPILSKHRKAIVQLKLEKKTSYAEAPASVLKNAFAEAIKSKDTVRALEVQHAFFSRANRKELAADLFDSIELPMDKGFIGILNNRTAFSLKEDLSSVRRTIAEFKELQKLVPGKAYIDYNLAVLRIKAWALNDSTIDPVALKKDINGLLKKGIPVALIKKVTLNYHIILSEVQIAMRDYAAKNETLKYIYSNYKAIALNDRDLLQVAMYFSSYSRLDWAEKILVNRAKSIDADEDLIFFYLNLTIIDPKNLKKAGYKSIISNASNKNKQRFCKMFDPYGKGGINFQLLKEDYLKKSYCEVCK